MKNLAHLYRALFRKTNGFVLNWPLGNHMKIGDFFAIRPRSIDVVGNIYERYFELDIKDTFADDIYRFSSPVLEPFVEKNDSLWEVFYPPKDHWQLLSNCYSDYKSNKMLEAHKRKIIAPDVNQFATQMRGKGSFFFDANNVHHYRMPHFKEIHKEVIRRLTTEFFNYHKIFLVTDVALVKDFSMGISREDSASLIVSMDDFFDGTILDLLSSDVPYTVERVEGVEHLKLQKPGGAIAFKAKKLDLSLKAREVLIREIYNSADKNIQKYATELMNNELFHLFPKIEINPGNANDFFEWSDLTLEDVEYFLEVDEM